MRLLALNLLRSSAINCAIYGNFSGPKCQEIVVSKGNAIELLRPDETGKIISICTTPVFSVVRSLLAFRLAGANRDYVVIGSDSGKTSIVEFDSALGEWKLVHCVGSGKTGCRRIVPGQYLAADPKGRAIISASIEKQKFVYVLNRDSANRLTISSPLEAHKNESIIFSVCGVDVGFDNPLFALIEMDYAEADQDPTGEAAAETDKKLTFYELDLGLNHVVRKWSEPISRTANLLLTVPGGDDGPSGVLICGENWVSFKNQGHVEVRAALPRREGMPAERGVLIVTGTVHKQKDMFFFLIQSEFGDVYKVTLQVNSDDKKVVEDVIITVFDTIQTANSICITKTGLLFVASEFGNHSLYQFQGIGDSATAVCSRKVQDESLNEELGDDSISASRVAPQFAPKSHLQNLLLIDDMPSLAPITDCMVDDFGNEESPQLLALCGRGHRSTLRVLRQGISVTEMAVSELPGRPQAVWTVRLEQGETFDRYIVVSLNNSTLVLSIGETVEEVTDSGFLGTTPTIQVVLLEDSALLQVHLNGIRHIRADKRVSEWKAPGNRIISKAAVNSRQVVVSLEGGELICFELDQTGQLTEMGSMDLGQEVSSLDIGLIPAGRVRSSFLAVGCWDNTVQLLSLDPAELFVQRASLSLLARAESLCLVEMKKEVNANDPSSSNGGIPRLFLNVGLSTGVLIKVAVDPVTGSLGDTRQRFLGPKSLKLFRVLVRGQAAVLVLSTRPWLMYNHQDRYFQAPITYETMEYASSFCSDQCPEGLVAIAGNTLRIVTVDNLGEQFNQTAIPLRYTPRKMCRLPETSHIAIIETDHNEFNESERAAMISVPIEEPAADDEETEQTVLPLRGPIPATDGKWASCIRIIEPISGNSLEVLELQNNEAAFSICSCRFQQRSEESFLVVGTAKDMLLHPRKITAAFLRVYRVLEGRLQLLHATPIDEVPTAMCEFQGKLLVGSGKALRLFELGKKKLLRKCENKLFPTTIVRLQCIGDRIYAGDITDSVHFVRYRKAGNTLSIFADDVFPRFITSLAILDYDTVAASDKFGNIFVLRMPEGASDDVEVASGARLLWDQGLLSGAPIKLELKAHYYLGEAITSLVKTHLVPGGPEVIVASTISGGIFGFVSLNSKETSTLFQQLEMFMRQECSNLCQRDHLSFRSYFHPVKESIDGDLCERYGTLPLNKQKEFANDIDRTPVEIAKVLEDARNVM